MKLSEYFNSGTFIHENAKLLIDLKLDTGESMKAGQIGSLLLDFGDETYHFEHNGFACRVSSKEIEIL